MFILIHEDGITRHETLLGTIPSRSGRFHIEPVPGEYTLQPSLDPLLSTNLTEIFPNISHREAEKPTQAEFEEGGLVEVDASGFDPRNREQEVRITGFGLDNSGFYISNKSSRGTYFGKRDNPEVRNHRYTLITGKVRDLREYRKVKGSEQVRRGLGYKMKKCVIGWERHEEYRARMAEEHNGRVMGRKETL